MNIRSLPMLMLLVFAHAGRGDDDVAKSEQADAIIQQEMHRYGIVGVTVGVRAGDRIVHEKAYGLAKVDLAVPARLDTVYQLTSTTKTITGTAMMKVLSDKNIPLDTAARTLLPELPEAWAGVTVRQLASHLSG